jgi:hypothetical protein
LTIRPEQPIYMALLINQILKEKFRICSMPCFKMTDNCLSIASYNCLLLMTITEIIYVPACESDIIPPTILHFHNIHDLVFPDPRYLHLHY